MFLINSVRATTNIIARTKYTISTLSPPSAIKRLLPEDKPPTVQVCSH